MTKSHQKGKIAGKRPLIFSIFWPASGRLKKSQIGAEQVLESLGRPTLVRYSRNPPNERPAQWAHIYFWLIFQKSETSMFLGKIFPIQLYIGFLEKSVKNKYASIGRVAHWAGYGNNA